MRTLVFYAAAGAGAGLALLVGLGAWALAGRLAFAAWGLTMAVAWVLLLRWGRARRWPGHALTGRLLLVFALGLTLFAQLEARYFAELNFGFHARLPAHYVPYLAHPTSARNAALALAVVGALVLVVGRHLPRIVRPAASRGPRPGDGIGGAP